MPIITLPDGKKLNYGNIVTGFEVAKDISISLSKKALALQIDGEYKDLDTINSYLAVCKDMGWYGEYEKGAAEWAARRYNEIRRELARL